jgi:hypothetical protein
MNSIKHRCRKHEDSYAESWKWWMIRDEDEEGKRNATESVRKKVMDCNNLHLEGEGI